MRHGLRTFPGPAARRRPSFSQAAFDRCLADPRQRHALHRDDRCRLLPVGARVLVDPISPDATIVQNAVAQQLPPYVRLNSLTLGQLQRDDSATPPS